MAAAKAWLAAKENHGRSAAPTPKRANEQLLSGLRPGKPGGSPDANLLSALGCALQDSNRRASSDDPTRRSSSRPRAAPPRRRRRRAAAASFEAGDHDALALASGLPAAALSAADRWLSETLLESAAAVAAETAALCAREALLDADGAAAKLTAEQCDCAIDRDLLTRAERDGATRRRGGGGSAEVMRELAKKATRDELERALKTHRKTADLVALGLAAPPTSEGELRKAYHKMARAHHPDKGGDPAKFRRLKDAYTRATKQFKRARPAKEERAEKPEEEAEKPEAEKPEAEKPEAEKPEEEDEAREGEAMAKEDKDERVREEDDVEEGKATDSDAEDATPPPSPKATDSSSDAASSSSEHATTVEACAARARHAAATVNRLAQLAMLWSRTVAEVCPPENDEAEAALDALARSRLEEATGGGDDHVLVSAVSRLLASARDAVNASAYAAGARQPVLDASEAVNEAIEAARDAAGADGDAMAPSARSCRRAGDDLVRYRVSIAAIDLKSACDRAARATHRCAQAATRAATEAAAKLTKAHEDLARRAAAPPRDDDDDEEEEDKDDDGDDEKPAPAPEAPREDEDTEAKLRGSRGGGGAARAALAVVRGAPRGAAPRCAPSADQARRCARCAAAGPTIDDVATRYASARDAKRALEAASAWLLADAPEAEATAEALDARVFLVCAVHDGAACRSLCAALAPRLAAAVRGAPGGDELAKRTCGAILGRIAVLAGRFEVV
ncbi:hypothetical protein JL720_8704 [Aureococcus anophagefferens]|nr:hypothetical protein JL720_8704 [Aureococcus anophagefferens]